MTHPLHAMKYCTNCQETILQAAIQCRHCQTYQPQTAAHFNVKSCNNPITSRNPTTVKSKTQSQTIPNEVIAQALHVIPKTTCTTCNKLINRSARHCPFCRETNHPTATSRTLELPGFHFSLSGFILAMALFIYSLIAPQLGTAFHLILPISLFLNSLALCIPQSGKPLAFIGLTLTIINLIK